MKQPVNLKGKLAAGATGLMVMSLSVAGVELHTQLEGNKLTAYADPATKADPWTICGGATGWITVDGKRIRVVKGLTLTAKQCEAVNHEIAEDARAILNTCVTRPLNQNQSNGLILFTINVGPAACTSTAIKRVNAGDFFGAAKALLAWSCAPTKDPRYPFAHCGPRKRQMPGLLSRRKLEASLLNTPVLPFQRSLMGNIAAANAKLLEDAQ
ncbi:lysozyme [Asticcacaulis endophyticus]|uniref:Lysozyme n=1 Tax=Asticcacaulis endophyticus TaxID=1395890 RepID=A0A918PSZ1_9CAUL|nr:glycoside hydrolase family protein [Asticcacaulis endophyticus]GGZ21648.1 lysozyme [Asticcacaulis endophyticus]